MFAARKPRSFPFGAVHEGSTEGGQGPCEEKMPKPDRSHGVIRMWTKDWASFSSALA